MLIEWNFLTLSSEKKKEYQKREESLKVKLHFVLEMLSVHRFMLKTKNAIRKD